MIAGVLGCGVVCSPLFASGGLRAVSSAGPADFIQVRLGGRDIGEELADGLAGVVAAQGAILHLAVQAAFADFTFAAVADMHAVDLKTPHAVDVRGLEVGMVCLGLLASRFLPEGLVVVLVSDECRARRTVKPAH